VEKSVEAHCGAVLAGRWNYEGTALVTGKLSAKMPFFFFLCWGLNPGPHSCKASDLPLSYTH
jgi:hypothetical protein